MHRVLLKVNDTALEDAVHQRDALESEEMKPECCDDCHTSDNPYHCKLFKGRKCDKLRNYLSNNEKYDKAS